MTVEISFESYGVFEKIEKGRKMAVFGHIWANFVYVPHTPVIRF